MEKCKDVLAIKGKAHAHGLAAQLLAELGAGRVGEVRVPSGNRHPEFGRRTRRRIRGRKGIFGNDSSSTSVLIVFLGYSFTVID
jgi:hypothetical protein